MDVDPVGSRPEIAVELSNTQGHLEIDPQALSRLVRATLQGEGVNRAAISLAIVDDPTIHAVNRRHLAHDWPTDVITFGLSEPGDAELAAELVVSAQMAAETAATAGTDPHAELALYVVHGLLHLCGLDDTTPEAAALMREREGQALARAGLANTFATVGSEEGSR